ncbi:MAG: glycine cleavage system protein GcvH [Phycisphaerales bacterium]|nr:glycine cleavage system protein GcvH [Phycisphaerales bacterium]
MASNIPDDLLYTDHDEWVRQQKGDIVAIGITDYAQDALGEIVHVEVPEVGDEVEADASVCEVESVKAVAEIYAPVSGEIIAVNEELDDEPEGINKNPYGAWIFKIKLSDPDELSNLMDAAAYKQKLEDGD